MQHCLHPLRLQSAFVHAHFIFIFCWENYSPHVFGYLLLLITVLCFHPLPELFKCCHCKFLISAKRPEHGQRTKGRFCHTQKKAQTRFWITDRHLQCWNANLVLEVDHVQHDFGRNCNYSDGLYTNCNLMMFQQLMMAPFKKSDLTPPILLFNMEF